MDRAAMARLNDPAKSVASPRPSHSSPSQICGRPGQTLSAARYHRFDMFEAPACCRNVASAANTVKQSAAKALELESVLGVGATLGGRAVHLELQSAGGAFHA